MMRWIYYLLVLMMLSSCNTDKTFFNDKIRIQNNEYFFSTQLLLSFKKGDTSCFYQIDKNNNVIQNVAPVENSYLVILYSHILKFKNYDELLFVTQIPNKYLFNIPDTLERRFTATSYLNMDPDEYSRKMQEIEKQPELYEYYYFDNSRTTLFGPYTKNEISEIAKSMGYHYPNPFN